MFTRSNQISSPMLLPLIGSILATSVAVTLILVPPSRPSLSLAQLFLRAAIDLTIAACIHLATVWAIWRLIREYLHAPVSLLMLHIWAAIVWLPLVSLLHAEHSLWLCCIVPWACANAIIYLALWDDRFERSEPESPIDRSPRPLFQTETVVPLWRTLLPYVAIVITAQAGAASLMNGSPWMAAGLFSICLLILLLRHPIVRPDRLRRQRRRFSKAAFVQTATAFFLLATALTPFLQRAYGVQSLSGLLAIRPPVVQSVHASVPSSGYSGVILMLPPKPHPRIVPPTKGEQTSFSAAIAKPVVIPFDGVYWYFKHPDLQPRRDARVQHGDPIKANVRSTDEYPLQMEAHQLLPTPVSLECCHALRVDLLNGDARPGIIRLEVRLKDTSLKNRQAISLGSIVIPSSQVKHISLTRPPVHESMRFELPAAARHHQFDEITLVIAPDKERARGGSKIAIQNFVLMP